MDSLLLGTYELIHDVDTIDDDIAASTDGWIAALAPAWTLGNPIPDTATIESLYLDGSAITGRRSQNRQIQLPVAVLGDSRLSVAKGVATVQQLLDSPSFTVTWTPDPVEACDPRTTNLLDENTASFTDDTSRWTPGTCTIARIGTLGAYSLRMTKTGSGPAMTVDSTGSFLVKPNTAYTFTADFFNTTAPFTRRCQISVTWLDQFNNMILSSATHADIPSGGHAAPVVTVTSPINAFAAQVQLLVSKIGSNPFAAGEQWSADALALMEGTDGTFQPGWVSQYQGAGYLELITPLPVVFDSYRGTAEPGWDLVGLAPERQRLAQGVNVTCQARPFGRSPGAKTSTISVTGPTSVATFDTGTGGSLTGIDVTVPGGTTVTFSYDAALKTSGTASARVEYLLSAGSSPTSASLGAIFDQPLPGTTDLSVFSALTFDMFISALNSIPAEQFVTPILVDTTNRERTLVRVAYGLVPGYFPGTSSFTSTPPHTLTVNPTDYTSQDAGFDLTQVNKVRFHVHGNATSFWSFGTADIRINIDRLIGVVSGGASLTRPNGGIYTITDVGGTARTPINLQASKSGGIQGLVVHLPPDPDERRPDYTPMVPYGSDGHGVGSDVAMPSWPWNTTGNTAGVRHNHTVAVWLADLSISVTTTLTFTVTETYNDPVHPSDTATRSISRSVALADVSGGLLFLGFIEIPVRDVPNDNTATSIKVRVDSSAGSVSVQDVLLLDTRGTTVALRSTGSREVIWIDEPAPDVDLGLISMGSITGGNGRLSAVAIWDATRAEPLLIDPGSTDMLIYAVGGRPDVQVRWSDRWLGERLTV